MNIEASTPPYCSRDIAREQGNRLDQPFDVLLVEDNKVNQQYVTLILVQTGYRVTLAENGFQAIDAVCDRNFEAVLMDLQMPGMNGVEAIRRIRNLPHPKHSVPILAMSAHTLGHTMEQCLAAGADYCIAKPFRPQTLTSALTNLIIGAIPDVAALVSEISDESDGEVKTYIEGLPALDLEQLVAFRSVFSPPKIQALITLYLIDIEARLSLIAEHRAAGDFDGVSRQAHMIVSAAGNLGAARTSALARTLELCCADQDVQAIDERIEALQVASIFSSCALKQWNFSHTTARSA